MLYEVIPRLVMLLTHVSSTGDAAITKYEGHYKSHF